MNVAEKPPVANAEIRIPTRTCPGCGEAVPDAEVRANACVCPRCKHYFPMPVRARIAHLTDPDSFRELFDKEIFTDPLNFPDYREKFDAAKGKSRENEGVLCGTATIGGHRTALFVMDPAFMMGSMGTVVGDRITALFEYAIANRLPVIGYTVSGGARMQEGMLSLMQMAKTSAAIRKHSEAGLFYLPVLTDPTTGGVTASFAMLGDVILAEPGALIGFAGPRVIAQTIGQKLPEGFQRAEFLVEKGIIDGVVERQELKETVWKLLNIHQDALQYIHYGYTQNVENLPEIKTHPQEGTYLLWLDMTALGIPCYAASRRYAAAPLCPQLLGYLDGEGHGAAGLEKALDALLTGSGARDTLLCPVTAQGTLRTGEQVQHLQADSGAVGARLTLARSVQRAAEAVAAQTMTTGCILVLDVRTAALRACVSVPGFDPADPAASLEAPDSPFLNRALQAYAVGSVFKPVLAAAALEAGLAPEYDCNGAVVVDGQIFRCAGGVPHGEVDLSAALAKSCNGYFIRLGQQLGAQALLQQAQALGFGRSIGLAEGLTAQSGALPGAEELAQSGQLANFSFGQGSLLATPLQVAAMMNTIANGGVYRAPCLLDCALDEASGEELSAFARPQAERVLTEQTAAALCTMLEQTVAEGTAQDASGLRGGAAGKTGTAQTGQFTAEGKERMNLWFAGFYPAEDPQYTIVVLQDGQTQAAVSSAAVFAQLCTALHWLG